MIGSSGRRVGAVFLVLGGALAGLFLFTPGACRTTPDSGAGPAGSPWPAPDRFATEDGKNFRLTVYDAVVAPGGTAALSAKLEKVLLVLVNPDVKGRSVSFRLDGKPVGEAVTAGEGVATVTVPAPSPGPHLIEASLGNGRASGILLVAPPNARAFVTDIDHTISDFPEPKVPFASIETMPALPDAPEVLRGLSKRYVIVYLTARDDAILQKTKAWLRLRDFPWGPVLGRDLKVWDLFSKGQGAPAHKRRTLEALRRILPDIRFGAGDLAGDVDAYLSNGVRPFLIAPAGTKIPEGAALVSGWRAIEASVEAAEREGGRAPAAPR